MKKKFQFIHIIFIRISGIDETVDQVKAVGGKCTGYKVDISKKEDVYKAAEQIREDEGDVSQILFGNLSFLFTFRSNFK